jgi:hypothetical protein
MPLPAQWLVQAFRPAAECSSCSFHTSSTQPATKSHQVSGNSSIPPSIRLRPFILGPPRPWLRLRLLTRTHDYSTSTEYHAPMLARSVVGADVAIRHVVRTTIHHSSLCKQEDLKLFSGCNLQDKLTMLSESNTNDKGLNLAVRSAHRKNFSCANSFHSIHYRPSCILLFVYYSHAVVVSLLLRLVIPGVSNSKVLTVGLACQ